MASPLLILVSAPSGAGKTTLCQRLLATDPRLKYSISCTTRPPREGERNGESYHFLSRSEFETRIARGEFLEWAEVYGHLYGTLRSTVVEFQAEGFDVLMDVDVQGARLIRQTLSTLPEGDPLKRSLVDIFIAPPSLEELRSRIEARAQDQPDVIERRMAEAEAEMAARTEYRHLVCNDDLETAFEHLQGILTGERERCKG